MATSSVKPSAEKISKNIKGGARPGAGRKPGSPNKKTAEVIAKAEQGGMMPLEYMLSIMRNPQASADARLDAAKASAPYVHAKLASIEVNANVTNHEASLDDLA